ncbi:CHAD domain-containing protein [Pseudarthrobacter sp. J64]|uniref:CHAD domain-containing protein n=1 Tax=Pseudarthrobacter sp. J64 TaxID=3116485 RepID=UPI002E810F2E|nr:CHAD domain-containing protein [Pseudarthrobacter sp. J64]MEE2568675.1 CHAD domain-containing protein [Pseudarthrobacter sp. J64]
MATATRPTTSHVSWDGASGGHADAPKSTLEQDSTLKCEEPDTGTPWRRPAALRGFIGALDAHSAARAKLLASEAPGLDEYRLAIKGLQTALDASAVENMGRKKARAALESRWKKVQKHLEATMAETPEDAHFTALHETRKALKKLRYAVEAVADAFPDRAGTILEPAVVQQRLLGEQHDAVVARARLNAAAGSHALDPSDAAALESMESARAHSAEVEFYRAVGQDPVPTPKTALKK